MQALREWMMTLLLEVTETEITEIASNAHSKAISKGRTDAHLKRLETFSFNRQIICPKTRVIWDNKVTDLFARSLTILPFTADNNCNNCISVP